MIGVSGALIAAVLLLFLILAWFRTSSKEQDLSSYLEGPGAQEGDAVGVCPGEFVAKIFAGKDEEFVAQMGSSQLAKLFRQERSAVAVFWVRQTSAAIRRILREHLETSRASKDVEFATEAGIFLQYAQLRIICGILLMAIELAGPQGLQGLAQYADQLTQRIRAAQRAFESAGATSGMHKAGAA
jgi:hypothetical protein